MKKIIIIEDEQRIGELLQLQLRDAGYEVKYFADGITGFRYVLDVPFDLLVLDYNLPGIDGLEICLGLRSAGINSPILMLTSRKEELEKIQDEACGADDYITKPFGIPEFLSRIKELLRAKASRKISVGEMIVHGDLEINHARREVRIKGNAVELSQDEFNLLYQLAENPGVSFERKELCASLWKTESEDCEERLHDLVNQLRRKIEVNPDHPEYLLTTWGIGYRFRDED